MGRPCTRVDMVMYNDEEYENLLQFDEEWTRDETDYLFDLLVGPGETNCQPLQR